MIVDYKLSSYTEPCDFDICIIGAGAIGLSMALYLESKTNFKIAMVEKGGLESQKASGDEVNNTGDIMSGLSGSRAFGFGGSTTIWGGQALKFNKLDFSERSWIKHSGWPVAEKELEPYYDSAAQLIGVGESRFDTYICSKDISLAERASFRECGLDLTYSKFSPEPNFQTKYQEKIHKSKRIFCYLDSDISITQNTDNNAIINLTVSPIGHEPFKLHAKNFTLACGGIETSEFLLNSGLKGLDQLPVGRFYQDHIGFYGAKITPLDMNKFRNLFATRMKQGVKHVPKLALHENTQVDQKLVNINATLEVQSSADDPLNIMRMLYHKLKHFKLNTETFKLLATILKHPIELISACYEYFIKKRIFIPQKGSFFLIANIESAPNYNSTIELVNDQAKQTQINWLTSALSRQTAAHFYSAIKQALEENNIAEVKLKDSLNSQNEEWLDDCYGLYHHMGATRMSKSPELGVVNSNSKIHTIPNLYIAGTSTLPTGSASNPTFTALALALRLCDHLSEKNEKIQNL